MGRGIDVRRKDREVTDIGDIMRIIGKCKVCHLAMIDKGVPYVVPLNFGYKIDGDELTLYFHSANEGRKIEILKGNNAVCFEMAYEGKIGLYDNPCNSGYFFESGHGFGKAEFVDDVNEKCEALSLLMKHQANREIVFTKEQAEKVIVFKVTSKDFTGKKKSDPSENSL